MQELASYSDTQLAVLGMWGLFILSTVLLGTAGLGVYACQRRPWARVRDTFQPLTRTPWQATDAVLLLALFWGTQGLAIIGHDVLRPWIAARLPAAFNGLRQVPWDILSPISIYAVCLTAIYIRLRQYAIRPAFSFTQWRRWIRYTCVAFFITLPLIWFTNLFWNMLLLLFNQQPALQDAIQIFLQTENGMEKFFFAGMAAILAPLYEETLFRGILLPLGIRYAGVWNGILLSSLLFSLMHFHLGSFLPLFVLSIILSWCYAETKSIVVPILFHALFNLLHLLTMGILIYTDMI